MITCETEELYAKFKLKAEAVAANVYRVANAQEANLLIAEQLKGIGAKKIVISQLELTDRVKLANEISREGFEVHISDLRRHSPSADVGISQLAIAVAETGSLAQDVTDVDSRLVASLSTVHIALVPTQGLTPSLEDALLAFYNSGKIPAHLCFTTGPSRTSDIERVLTIGVHGPEKLLIVFVDQGGQE